MSPLELDNGSFGPLFFGLYHWVSPLLHLFHILPTLLVLSVRPRIRRLQTPLVLLSVLSIPPHFRDMVKGQGPAPLWRLLTRHHRCFLALLLVLPFRPLCHTLTVGRVLVRYYPRCLTPHWLWCRLLRRLSPPPLLFPGLCVCRLRSGLLMVCFLAPRCF